MPPIRRLAAGLIITVFVAACGGSAPTPETEGGQTQTDPTAVPTPEPETTVETTEVEPSVVDDGADRPVALDMTTQLGDLLRWMPPSALDGNVPVRFVSYDLAAAAFDITPADCTADDTAAADQLRVLISASGRVPIIAGPFAWATAIADDPADLGRTLGIRLCEVGAFAEWPADGSATTIAIATSADPTDVAQRVANDELWNDLLVTASVGDIDYWTWGDGLDVTFTRGSPARGVGQAGTLGFVDDGVVLRTLAAATHEASIDAGTTGTSMTDQPAFDDAITLLEDLGTYTVAFARPPGPITAVPVSSPSDDEIPALRRELEEWGLLESFEWVAWAAHHDGTTDRLTIILAHDTAEAAEANAQTFARRLGSRLSWMETTWGERLGFSGQAVGGELAVFEFTPESIGFAYTILGEQFGSSGTLFASAD